MNNGYISKPPSTTSSFLDFLGLAPTCPSAGAEIGPGLYVADEPVTYVLVTRHMVASQFLCFF
jgi:hypothetical protein